MGYIFHLIVFMFGAALGSFVSVVAGRYNTGLVFWRGNSLCFTCGSRLGVLDLFPVFSFLFLKGRCRHCGSGIPLSNFIVEIMMGGLSLLAANQAGIFDNYQFIPSYILLIAIFAVVVLITLYDLRHFIIPDSFLIILLVLAFLYNLPFITSYSSVVSILLSGIILTLPFLIMFLASRGQWLGLGDVKYIAVIGALLGLIRGVSAVVLGFWAGAIYAILALFVLRKNITMKSEIPFGPFLSLGIVISLLCNIDLFHLNDLF